MSAKLSTVARVTGLGLVAGVFAILLLVLPIPAKIHGWLLGLGAIVFAIADLHFRNLISGLNTIYTKGSYSVWQIEQMDQVIPKWRSRVWNLWCASFCLKAVVLAIAVLLQWEELGATVGDVAICVGYALLVVTSALLLWAKRNVSRIEAACDQLVRRECELKEQKRLRSELSAGTAHDFSEDPTLRSYSKTARL